VNKLTRTPTITKKKKYHARDHDAFFMMNSPCILNLLLIYKINIPNIISTKKMVNGTQEQRTTGTRKHKPQHQDTMELKTRQKTSTQYDQNKSASSLNTPPIPAGPGLSKKDTPFD
jgi:hypothetical protein